MKRGRLSSECSALDGDSNQPPEPCIDEANQPKTKTSRCGTPSTPVMKMLAVSLKSACGQFLCFVSLIVFCNGTHLFPIYVFCWKTT